MPKTNGLEMIKKIRDIDSNVPILITSAYDDTSYLMQSIQYKINGYIIKPFKSKELIKNIHEIIKELYKRKKETNHLNLLKAYQTITDYSSIVSKTDIDGFITYVNDEFCKISGYTKEELIGQKHNIVRANDESESIFEELWEIIKEKKETWSGVIKNQTKDGEFYYVKTTIQPIVNDSGDIQEFIASRTLVTNIIHPKKLLLDFLASIESAFVVLIKIENFNYLELSLTESESAKIQKKFAEKLFSLIPRHCQFSRVYHLGNGEFVFAKDTKTCIKETDKLSQQIKKFQQSINKANITIEPLEYTLSIIVSFSHGKDALKNAKIGLEELLKSKKTFIYANDLLNEQRNSAMEKIKTFQMVQKAIDSYNIISYFQPIVNNQTKKIEKYESLVRLIDEEDKIHSPYHFLEIAKESKYYEQITSMVLTNSFKALHETDMNISINFSSLDIEKSETKKTFFKLLEAYKKEAPRIILELLEDESIHNINNMKQFIKKVKTYGVKIAIDDFGAGYSNFQRVLEYKPDIIKIDGSLIKNIEKDKFSQHMVETIVAFAKKQNILTIAEYVESKAISKIVTTLGVDYSQGYYFGKPNILPKLMVSSLPLRLEKV